MEIRNTEVADQFDRLADLLDIEGANAFRVRAYRSAAQSIRNDPRSLADRISAGEDLSELPGIGKDLAEKIRKIIATGTFPLLVTAEKRTPSSLCQLLRVQGLGPKRVRLLHEQLGIGTIEDLSRAARSGQLQSLKGFGKQTEQLILAHLQQFAHQAGEFRLKDADDFAAPLLEYLQADSNVIKVSIAGSVRRRKETVGDIDIVVAAKAGSNRRVMERFVEYEAVEEVISLGDTRSDARLRCGIVINLRVVARASYGAALLYFTGSRAHTIEIRKRAVKQKLKVNEYGVFRGQKRLAGATEQSVYAQLGLPEYPPELRENRGELEIHEARNLPRLIRLSQIRGDLHAHTKASDGRASLAQMAEGARKLGHEYLAITEHSRRLRLANGLDRKRLLQQMRAIDRLNGRLKDMVLLKSIEVDILESGALDLPDSILADLDLVVCAIHHQFHLPERKQTERILRAMDNRNVNILAHPSGRLIQERPAYTFDLLKVMQAAAERGCALELNAQPQRLDLTDRACQLAKQCGVQIAISSDAHSVVQLQNLRYGIDQGRRGWLEKSDVINTLTLAQLRKRLQR